MAEKRRLDRIKLVMVGKLMWDVAAVDCQLENLSMDGALISTKGRSSNNLSVGDICKLQIPQEAENFNLTIQAEVVHQLSTLVGLKFVGLNLRTYSALEYVIQQEREKQGFLGMLVPSSGPSSGAIS